MPSYDNDKNIRRDRDVHEMIKCASSIISNEMGEWAMIKGSNKTFWVSKYFYGDFFIVQTRSFQS